MECFLASGGVETLTIWKLHSLFVLIELKFFLRSVCMGQNSHYLFVIYLFHDYSSICLYDLEKTSPDTKFCNSWVQIVLDFNLILELFGEAYFNLKQ